jgi:pimeloyl-ACP methyl ester carboxylesterase
MIVDSFACPKEARCMQVSVHTSTGDYFLDVQSWYEEKKSSKLPLYFLVGGPGQSGIDLGASVAPLLSGLNREIIFFSPLGTQRENPFPCSGQIPSLVDAFSLEQNVDKCIPNNDFSVEDYSSLQVARHLEQIRIHLGHEKIIVLGSSYGTRVAQLYERMYPQFVHKLVLDSGLPLDAYIGSSSNAVRILEERLDEKGEIALTSILEQLPVMVHTFDSTVQENRSFSINKELFFLALHHWLYRVSDQLRLTSVLYDASEGNWRPFLEKISENIQEPLSLGVYLSVFCQEDIQGLCAEESTSLFPFCSHLTTQCAHWPKGNRGSHVLPKPKKSLVPTLILHGYWDPVSSISYAQRLRENFLNGIWVEFEEEAHGVSLTPCGRNLIHSFLEEKPLDANHFSCREKIRIR